MPPGLTACTQRQDRKPGRSAGRANRGGTEMRRTLLKRWLLAGALGASCVGGCSQAPTREAQAPRAAASAVSVADTPYNRVRSGPAVAPAVAPGGEVAV